jgi:hypothetical protein
MPKDKNTHLYNDLKEPIKTMVVRHPKPPTTTNL